MAMNKELSGAQKAAILLRAIGEEAAAAVMKTLDPKDIRKLGEFMKEAANITKQEEDSVIAEFEQASSNGEVQFEGREFMEAILKKALGPEKAARMMESLNTKTYPGIDALKWVDARTVAQILKIEHPQSKRCSLKCWPSSATVCRRFCRLRWACRACRSAEPNSWPRS
ncbi:MAG: hypothetical protein DYH03_13625 [Nitrospira sp. NTP1]|nr:hypothetical protein [Nitrospira sp. NTP1]